MADDRPPRLADLLDRFPLTAEERAAYYLKVMGYSPPDEFPVEDVIELCVRVSTGALRDPGPISSEIRRLWGIEATKR